MQSLFSRSRTFSTPQKKQDTLDEFGRVSSGRQTPTSTSKKDKKKQAKRAGTLPDPPLDHPHFPPAQFPDGTFLPLNLDRPKSSDAPQDSSPAAGQHPDPDYGFLCFDRHVVLGLDQLERLVDVLANELETRGGLTTPFVFTNTALDINPSRIKRLVRSFVEACAAEETQRDAQAADLRWRDEARFAGPHELGMALRWGLARAIRSVGGQDVRGLVSWDHYCEWRDSEAALQYPPSHFQTFLPPLPPALQFILLRLLSLLARLIANSTSSGHTPPTLSPLFGPLFFGLGPPTLAFHHAYMHYLRGANAMEHVILAFIRWQDAPRAESTGAAAAALGVPIRLKEWIKGYPANLPALASAHAGGQGKMRIQPRTGARTVRVVSVRRNVRMYSPDLVRTASTWGQSSSASVAFGAGSGSGTGATNGTGSGNGNGTHVGGLSNSWAKSKEWDRIAPGALKLPPRYAEGYKRKMNIPNGVHPEVVPGSYPSSSSSSSSPLESAPPLSLSSTLSSIDSNGTTGSNTSNASTSKDYFGMGLAPATAERQAEKFRSLTDLRWGEFEDMGFGSGATEEKLRFDLTESARQERKSKRQTLDWADFSSSGFTRMDAPLSATLQFSTPVLSTISSWPHQQPELHKKLKKQQKSLPAFGWDTEPVVGTEEVVEAAFVDVFCDLVYGGGWMDLERAEGVDRECNWALVEYKSLPPSRSTVSGGTDPRTDTTTILFEEFVPLEYRQQLALPPKSRRRLPSLFSSSSSSYSSSSYPSSSTKYSSSSPFSSYKFSTSSHKSKQWKQAATLNGRPYVVGAVPASPSFREVEFEGMLMRGTGTKQISLSSKLGGQGGHGQSGHGHSSRAPGPSQTGELNIPPPPNRPAPRIETPRPTHTPEPPSSSSHRGGGTRGTGTGGREELPSDVSGHVFTPSKKSRFRIPVPSPTARRSVLVPAEYSAVEFQTRMASYSDDEHGGSDDDDGSLGLEGDEEAREEAKQRRRASRADAWVDILVSTQSRRMDDQAASAPPHPLASGVGVTTDRRGRQVKPIADPDSASLEVAQVLAAVSKGRQASPESVQERRVYSDYDVDEVQTVPRHRHGRGVAEDRQDREDGSTMTGTGTETEEDGSSSVHLAYDRRTDEGGQDEGVDDVEDVLGSILNARQMAREQRRLGYFDLHPERRPVSTTEDPRARFRRGDSDEEDEEDEEEGDVRYGKAEVRRPLRALPVPPQAVAEPPAPVPVTKRSVPEIKITTKPTPAPSSTLPASSPSSSPSTANANPNATTTATATTPTRTGGSKTAALIEMYRERERTGSVNSSASSTPIPVAPLNVVSRLPVRSGSLPGKDIKVAPTPSTLTPTPAPASSTLTPTPPASASVAVPTPAVVAPTPTPAPVPASSTTKATPQRTPSPPESEPLDVPTSGFGADDPGRISPARYVHGAPLHNVIEEEEEEEE